jgi:tetratricopeptide (TPR) repeat protein
MKTLPALFLAAVVAVLAGGGAALLVRDEAAASHAAPAAADVAHLALAVEELQASQRDLRAAVDALALQVGTSQAAVSAADVDAAVARWLETRAPAAAPAAPAAPEAAAPLAALDVDEAFESLLDPDLAWEDREALWKKVREAGLTDELIALVEAFAAARPNDPDAQVLLGSSYLEKIYEVGNGPEAGEWAMKADASFDAALALDDHHWDARFTKAVSLSFWPPMFGKQAEAINHFNTLIAQQEAGPSKASHAQTYMWLGNLYLQQGKNDLAKQTYEKGLKNFPADEGLLKQLGLVQ